jgi:hypothetical protein
MTQGNTHNTVIVDLEPHYVEGVPWLIGRPNGERLGSLSVAASGLSDVPAGEIIRMIVPKDCGVNKSFFEGFLLDYSERTFAADSGLKLSELISIDPRDPEAGVHDRFHQTHANLSAALISLADFWQNKKVIGRQLEDAV